MGNCIVILGGSFDPVHNGHIALCEYFAKELRPDEIRLIPVGHPWQKERLLSDAEHRIEMLHRAFASQNFPIRIDRQEIDRVGPTYTIDTLRNLRAHFGIQASLVFLLGADQLKGFNTWKNWQHLFDYAHFCSVTRPGYSLRSFQLPKLVADAFISRSGSLEDIRNTPCGFTHLSNDLAIDVSATDIRAAVRHGETADLQVPPAVLDYIKQSHLYKD